MIGDSGLRAATEDPKQPRTSRWERNWANVPPEWQTATYRLDTAPHSSVFVRNTNYLRSSKEYPFRIHGPQRLTDELAWWVWTCWDEGWRKIDPAMLAWWKRTIDELVARRAQFTDRPVESLVEFDPAQVGRLAVELFRYRTGREPSPGNQRNLRSIHEDVHLLLSGRCSDEDWWEAPRWHLRVDTRIPRREHEPKANASINIGSIRPSWLREGVRHWLRDQLVSEHFAWSTALSASHQLSYFGTYCHENTVSHPMLVSDDDDLREFATHFLGWLHTPEAGVRGQRLGQNQISAIQSRTQMFYEHMVDERRRIARLTSDPRWLELGAQHTRLFPRSTIARRRPPSSAAPDKFISAADLSLMACHIPILGAPTDEEVQVTAPGREPRSYRGLADESAMRAWLLQALTGRRVSEVLLLDFNPLSMLFAPEDSSTADASSFVARLRYQQTKVDGVDPTILVEQEVVNLVQSQQAWVRQKFPDLADPPHLFPALRHNHRGTQPRPRTSHHDALRRLDDVVKLVDGTGNALKFSATHRLRHTRATELLAGGVPIHVVQRYLGHLSPEMTMRYAKTLTETAEAEFLRYKKIGADARELTLAPREIYDMTMLGKRTDRILPNGVCLLPPAQDCDKGNACLGCSHFATDRSHLDELQRQRTATQLLIEQRQRAFHQKTGKTLTDDNVWVKGRLAEVNKLDAIIQRLNDEDDATAVSGAGVAGRTRIPITPRTHGAHQNLLLRQASTETQL